MTAEQNEKLEKLQKKRLAILKKKEKLDKEYRLVCKQIHELEGNK